MNIYVDTSALFALVDADDDNNHRARRIWDDLIQKEGLLIINNYLLMETITLLQRRIGISAVRDFHRGILPELYVDWIDKPVHDIAMNSLLTAGLRHLSLVDCSSFETMIKLEINTAFTFDPHFAERGFETLPSL